MIHYLKKQMLADTEFPFHIGIDKYRSGESCRLHDHDFTELFYVAGGEGVHRYKDRETYLGRGCVLIIQPGVEHSYQVAKGSYLRIYQVAFCQDLLGGEWPALDHALSYIDPFFIDPSIVGKKDFISYFTLTPSQRFELLMLLEKMYSEYDQKKWGYHCLIRLQLMELFVYLSRWTNAGSHQPGDPVIMKQDLYQEVCKYIKQHYMNPITLEQVCTYCGISQSAFTRNFKRVTGLSFIEYRNKERIQAAKDLLITTDLTIMMISAKVGFSNVSNFDRVFKHFEGLSPLVYRKHLTASDRSAFV